jgi:hypothetical protein
MPIRYKASIKGYHRRVWFDKNDNEYYLPKHLEETVQDHFTIAHFDAVIVHMKQCQPPNMEFKMDESGLHFKQPVQGYEAGP